MKKLAITFISSLLLFSCSTDDNSSVPNQKGQLVMEVNTKETYVNKPVYFIVKDLRGNYSTHLAKITSIDNNDQTVAINGRYKPSKPGEFTFVAKATIDGFVYKDYCKSNLFT
ncbi:hypothetical protein SAMN04488018_10634 [Myroides marinus]|uniref:Uncharacterized protein n=1 Tax=Myroides marinus TaxID=703342 RepID=A0A1H6UC34_9FLAO|nr:hypothetical protein [Myroides marinus]KUF41529.1 hypothetical protein AS361_14155 [Myroides marinus]MDM1348920.1 hypothetical protein [Myroides marinus]MDM1371613.1 hypothetical protein [Myroides marinus]SEI87217.1 hypothetical protein SAMN04488018_10634 [Myroides marinus]